MTSRARETRTDDEWAALVAETVGQPPALLYIVDPSDDLTPYHLVEQDFVEAADPDDFPPLRTVAFCPAGQALADGRKGAWIEGRTERLKEIALHLAQAGRLCPECAHEVTVRYPTGSWL